jgi:ribonuclease P protein component
VLPAASRLRHSRDFTDVVRRGARAGRKTLVVHLVVPGEVVARPARAGFVVSSSVGGSVQRHAVVRRLRPLVARRLGALPAGSRLVVRALPPAARADSAELAADLSGALTTALQRTPVGVR